MTGVRRSSSIPRTDGFRPRGRGRRSSSQPTTTTSQRRPTAPCGSWWAASGCTVQRIAGSPSVVCSGSTPARRSCRFSPRGPLQPEHAALSDAGPRGRLHRDGARGAYRAARWAGPAAGRHPSVGWAAHAAAGGQHAGARDDQLHRQDGELRPVHAPPDRDGPATTTPVATTTPTTNRNDDQRDASMMLLRPGTATAPAWLRGRSIDPAACRATPEAQTPQARCFRPISVAAGKFSGRRTTVSAGEPPLRRRRLIVVAGAIVPCPSASWSGGPTSPAPIVRRTRLPAACSRDQAVPGTASASFRASTRQWVVRVSLISARSPSSISVSRCVVKPMRWSVTRFCGKL